MFAIGLHGICLFLLINTCICSLGGAEPSDVFDWARNSVVQTTTTVKFAGDDDVDAFALEEVLRHTDTQPHTHTHTHRHTHTHQPPEADLGMFSMFGRTGAPQEDMGPK